jgi:hypothetical protein
MESSFSLKSFYKQLAKDFYSILISPPDENSPKKEEQKKQEKEKKKEEKIDQDINDIKCLTDCITVVERISGLRSNFPKIYDSTLNYLNEIKIYISQNYDNEEDFPEYDTTEHDIYRAYGFLWGIRYIYIKAKLEEISLFNCKDYVNFLKFLELYGNSKNISKNYNKNFQEEFKIKKKEINVKSISDWLQKLNDKKLRPMTKKPKINTKKNNKTNIAKVENGIENNKDAEEKSNVNYSHPENQSSSNENRVDDTKKPSIETKNINISALEDEQKSKNKEKLKKISENNIYHNNEIINDNSTNNIDLGSKGDESHNNSKKEEHNELPNRQKNTNNNIINIPNKIITTNDQKDNKATEGISKSSKSMTYEELVQLVISLNEKIGKLEKNGNVMEKRLKRLEINQLFLYNQSKFISKFT